MSKSTPGQWEVRQSATSITIHSAYGRIATMAIKPTSVRVHEALVDARLLAAGPEMCEALDAAVVLLEEEVQSLRDGHTVLYEKDPEFGQLDAEGRELIAPWEAALAAARAALAKASVEAS
jgi:hypothetical protein